MSYGIPQSPTNSVQNGIETSTSNTAPQQPEKPFRCEQCDRNFSARRTLQRHLRENKIHQRASAEPATSPSIIRCRHCKKVFVRAHDYRRHTAEQHGSGKVPCQRCNKLVRPKAPHKDPSGRECTGTMRARCSNDGRETMSNATGNGSPEGQSSSRPVNANQTLVANLTANPSELGMEAKFGVEADLDKGAGNDIRRASNLSYSQAIPCGICDKPFEHEDNMTLLGHLGTHYRQLTQGQVCPECDITFVWDSDLQNHLQHARSRSKRSCGFLFEHRTPCQGHHPPISRASKRSPAQENDRRNSQICLWHHEQDQLQRYLKSIDSLRYLQETRSQRNAQSACLTDPVLFKPGVYANRHLLSDSGQSSIAPSITQMERRVGGTQIADDPNRATSRLQVSTLPPGPASQYSSSAAAASAPSSSAVMSRTRFNSGLNLATAEIPQASCSVAATQQTYSSSSQMSTRRGPSVELDTRSRIGAWILFYHAHAAQVSAQRSQAVLMSARNNGTVAHLTNGMSQLAF